MQIYFNSRVKAREFSKNTGKKVHDNGTDSAKGKRWAHKLGSDK